MKRLMARTNAARAHAAKRAAAKKEKEAVYRRREFLNQKQRQERARLDMHRDARKRIHEDYELGPLAPRREVGIMAEKWGTIPRELSEDIEVPKENRLKYFPYVVGDRVCVIHGHDKGKIGKVKELNEDTLSVLVENMNRVDVWIDPVMRDIDPDDTTIIARRHKPIDISHVRLVYPLNTPNGGLRDVIINEFEVVTKIDEETGEEYPAHRAIPGLDNIEIPYPRIDETELAQDQPWDTLRILTEEQTFIPTMFKNPMPASVMDELRSKYSKTREVHDPEYVAKKMAEDAREEAKERTHLLMLTPRQELAHLKQMKKHETQAQREAFEKTVLVRLGEELARRQALAKQKKTQEPLAAQEA